MNEIKGVSLKIKLMLLLVSIACSVLLVYAFLALRDFENDKIAYVFESIKSHSQATANQLRSELIFNGQQLKAFTKGKYNIPSKENTVASFKPYNAVWIYTKKLNSFESELTWFGKKKDSKYDAELEINQSLIKEAMESDISLRSQANSGIWLFTVKLSVPAQKKDIISIAAIEEGTFMDAFNRLGAQKTFLVNHNNNIIISSNHDENFNPTDIQNTVNSVSSKLASPAGVYEETVSGGEKWLVSAAKVGISDLKVVSVVPKKSALRAVYILMVKSGLFLAFLFFVVLIISIFGANRLTGALRKLLVATGKVAKGDFDVEVKVKSRDEVGSLTFAFNKMTKEIKRLMAETADKVRMEEELKTAQIVQSTLFPDWKYDGDSYKIRGYYKPASECSGDWWHYGQIGSKLYMWIGDATGHGVPAALITSAAKSASAIIEQLPDIKISDILRMLNNAIHQTGGGQVNMTFFLGCYDKQSGEFTYCNASHDPPILFPFNKDGDIKKKDLVPLMENNGCRMGEAPESNYEQSTIKLKAGDRIVFYTDGVTELQNVDGKMWGERKFFGCLMKSFNESDNIENAISLVEEEINEFKGDAPLADDVTYFMFENSKAS